MSAPWLVVQVEAAFAKFGVTIWAALAPKYPAVDLGKVWLGRSQQPLDVASSLFVFPSPPSSAFKPPWRAVDVFGVCTCVFCCSLHL